jgi:TPP-dependent pyruvate/acetoin dehydrogenase alpha subunit
MPGLTHMSSGQEAVAIGVCSALKEDDKITSTHRGHGHCLTKGTEIKLMFCELLGKVEGYCRGKGGSMHIADQDHGSLGANVIVGAGAGIATGAALSAKRLGPKSVAVRFFGDGALGQGLIYEVMNIAALWKLPVIYSCENNLYGECNKAEEMAAGSLTARTAAFGIETHVVDGQDVLAVASGSRQFIRGAGRRPAGHRADMRRVEATLQEEAAARGVKLTALAFHMKALAWCLIESPRFNASLGADGETLVIKHYVHVGVPVDTPHGLFVPVIRGADSKGR